MSNDVSFWFDDAGVGDNKGVIRGVKSFGNNFDGKLVIPDEIKGIKVSFIINDSFKNQKSINELTIGKNVEVIGSNCFSGCGITELIFTKGMTERVSEALIIKERAFADNKLKNLKLPKYDGLVINDRAFYRCQIEGELFIPRGMSVISAGAFMENNITKVDFSDFDSGSRYAIRQQAFLDNSISYVDIPDAIKRVSPTAFDDDCIVLIGDETKVEHIDEFEGLFSDPSIVVKKENIDMGKLETDVGFKKLVSRVNSVVSIYDINIGDMGNILGNYIEKNLTK